MNVEKTKNKKKNLLLSKNTEDFGSTMRTNALHGLHAVLHRSLFAVLHLDLLLTLHASPFSHFKSPLQECIVNAESHESYKAFHRMTPLHSGINVKGF